MSNVVWINSAPGLRRNRISTGGRPMSADEFDPMIERLFARSPAMPDSADFAVRVEQRLNSGSRVRTLAVTLAGLVGGVIAVREAVGSNFGLRAEQASDDTVRVVGGGLDTVSAQAQTSLASTIDQLGL